MSNERLLFCIMSFFSVWSGCWISHLIFRNEENSWAITNNNIRQNLPAWIMLENVKHWSKCYFLFSDTLTVSLFLPTAQHALLADIQPLWPACPPSSTGIRIPVTLDTCIIDLFLYNYLRTRVHCNLFLCCCCLFDYF